MKVIFFGSTTDSVLVLEKLATLRICAVVTQPPRPAGRKQQLTPTPVEIWTKAHTVPVLSFPSSPSHPSRFDNEQTVIDTLQPFKADLLISASFGQRIPIQAIQAARFGGLNVHPSLLPRWRGADPVPWAIMAGDAQTGVTIVTLSKNFDEGAVIAQKKVPITEKDTSDPLRTKLFELGADLLLQTLSNSHTFKGLTFKGHIKPQQTISTDEPYARRLTRDDGFEPWEALQKAREDPAEAQRIDRKFRALTPWPGLWTEIEIRDKGKETSKTKKRLKILRLDVSPIPYHLSLDLVQLESKKPVPFAQFAAAYLTS